MKTIKYDRIWALVARIEYGRVASYKYLALLEGTLTPRMAGHAMACLPDGHCLPWQRVITSGGRVSANLDAQAAGRQRQLLEFEGIVFDSKGRIDFSRFGWDGPDSDWLCANGYQPLPGAAPLCLLDIFAPAPKRNRKSCGPG